MLEFHRPARHRELLEAHYGCQVMFQAGRKAIMLGSSDLERPFTTHSQELLGLIGAQLEVELNGLHAEPGVREQVKCTLKRSLAGRRPSRQEQAWQQRCLC